MLCMLYNKVVNMQMCAYLPYIGIQTVNSAYRIAAVQTYKPHERSTYNQAYEYY